MFTTAEKIFSGISNLKSRYYKYLEKLCISNGINISQLKNEGSKQMVLEMFFGGYNVMVGLKYFSNLKVLKLVNQEIVSLRPLNDICNSLEEFWLVEGILHDLTGIEHCKKLKRLYLYENKIEDGKLIGNLNNLEVLWIGENNFKCFNFIKNLENLTDLRINGTQCTDSNLISIAIWPPKLQILDVSNNQLTSPQPLILSCCCYMLQSIYIDWDFEDESKLKCSYKLIELLIYQFRYLSKINGESISDNKKILIKTSAEKTFLKTASLILNERDNLIDEINEIEKNYVKIKEKLYFFVVGLEKAKNNSSKREGRKHIASRLHEQCLYNLKNLKKIKSLAIEYEHLSFSLREYFININNLESIGNRSFPSLNEMEEKIFGDMLAHHFTLSKSHKINILFGCRLNENKIIEEKDMENIYCLGCPIKLGKSRLVWGLSYIIELLDKRELSKSDNLENLQIFKNIVTLFGNEEVKKSYVLIIPFAQYKNVKEENDIIIEENDDIESEEIVHWKDLSLVALTIVEVKVIDEFSLEVIKKYECFEKEIVNPIKKLPSMGIDISIGKKFSEHDEVVLQELTKEDKDKKDLSKIRKMTDIISQNISWICWNKEKYCNNGMIFSARSYMEVLLNFTKRGLFIDMIDFQSNVTILSLPNMRITKLDDLYKFTKLTYLNLSRNNLHSVKKLDDIPTLKYLDISFNAISKVEDLPEGLMYFKGCNNNLSNIEYLGKLENLNYVDVSKNKLKSLKGLNNSQNLITLLVSFNQISDKCELDILEYFQILKLLDMSNNPINIVDGYRKKILLSCKHLECLDREILDRNNMKDEKFSTGKVLTIELIISIDEKWKDSTTLNLENQNLQTIGLTSEVINDMKSIKKLILTRNKLTTIGELLNLSNLVELNLNENLMTSFVIIDAQASNQYLNLPNLEILKLARNGLTAAILSRLNIKYLKKIKEIDLSGNNLVKLDFSIFSENTNLERLSVQKNQIKIMIRKIMPKLNYLNLSSNKIKDIEQINAPSMEHLDISNNKIVTCSGLKVISKMNSLTYLDCRGNPVISRRVYVDFIKSQCKSVKILDSVEINSLSTVLNPIKMGKESVIIEEKPLHTTVESIEDTNIIEEDDGFWNYFEPKFVKPKWKNLKPLKKEKRINNDDYFYSLDDKIKINEDILSLQGTRIK